MKSKVLGLIALLLVILMLPACSKNSELEIGFGHQTFLEPIMGAAKSDHSDFEIDDVTLDFYFGGHLEEYSEESDRQTIGLALYFSNEESYRAIEFDTPYENYQEMNGLHFVKFISTEEFNSGEYGVEVTWFKGKTFQHYEALTVPAEVFLEGDDHFGLIFVQYYTLKEQSDFYVMSGGKNCLEIKYEFLDSHKIKLSEPTRWFGLLLSN